MKRRLLNVVCFVSAPLCAAVVVLWVQSWVRPRSVRKSWVVAPASSQPVYYQMTAGGMVPVYKPRAGAYAVNSQWGRVQVAWGEGVDLPAVLVGFFRHAEWTPDATHPRRLFGMYVERERPGALTRFRYIGFPYWLPAVITAPPAVRGVRVALDWRRRRAPGEGMLPAVRLRPARDAGALPGVRGRQPGWGVNRIGEPWTAPVSPDRLLRIQNLRRPVRNN
jgi:hypothetical protein